MQPESDQGLLAPIWAGSVAEARTGDGALIRAMLSAEAALARALASTGLAPARAAEVITRVAAELSIDPRALALAARSGGNPVIPLVRELRAAVAAADPDAVEWVHRGTTSQDVLDTAFMTVSAAVLSDAVLPGLAGAAEAAARLAAEHRDTVLAGRTLTQHAVPTTFGVKVAGWLSGLLDADERCRQVRAKLPAQLGGAAGTLAALDGPRVAVAEAFAAECGLTARETPWHTVRTPVAELAGALALATGACGKAALDVTVLAQTELGEVAGDPGGESSAMPQKRNPVTAALVVAAAREAPGALAGLHLALLAENERPAGAWHAEWQPWRALLRLAGGAAAGTARLLGDLRPDPEAMAATVRRGEGALLAERLAGALRPEFGTGAAAAVREAALGGRLPALLAEHGLDDPAGYLGAAPEFVDRTLARYQRHIEGNAHGA
ncbi:MAG: 3-carboxy-cis,cis-muconate cycloisomerase [Pseudonocardiales bacterium]|nr:3-carboxy-cis,cis-muconate cycloisomerase [Pseudonocardiales bacterium]